MPKEDFLSILESTGWRLVSAEVRGGSETMLRLRVQPPGEKPMSIVANGKDLAAAWSEAARALQMVLDGPQ